MNLTERDIEAIADAVAARLGGDGQAGAPPEMDADVRMVWIQDLADEKGVTRRTVDRTMERHAIPRRQRDGKLKTGGGRTYIFTLEYEGRERMSTRSVRNNLRRAGRITR